MLSDGVVQAPQARRAVGVINGLVLDGLGVHPWPSAADAEAVLAAVACVRHAAAHTEISARPALVPNADSHVRPPTLTQ